MTTTLEAIRSLRRAGLSQAEISRRTGIPQPRLCRWEGGSIPTAADDALLLVKLAAEMGAPDAGATEPSAAPDAGVWPDEDRRHPEQDGEWIAKPRRRSTDDPVLVARQVAPLGQVTDGSSDQPEEGGNAG